MTEQEKLINVDLYGDGSRDSRLRAEYIYCDHADVCSVYKEGKCFRKTTLFGVRCEFGRIACVDGGTKKTKMYGRVYSEAKDSERYHKLSYPNNTYIAKIGDGAFLAPPHVRIERGPESGLFCHNPGFGCNRLFVPIDELTPDNINRICTYHPRAMLGGEIESYQTETIPIFLHQLSKLFPEQYNAFIAAFPDYELKAPDYRGKYAKLSTCNRELTYRDAHGNSFRFDGDELVCDKYRIGGFMPFSSSGYAQMRIPVTDDMQVKITDSNQVTDQTVLMLSITSDCGNYAYGWVPTHKSESFMHLMARLDSGYLLDKLASPCVINEEATFEAVKELMEAWGVDFSETDRWGDPVFDMDEIKDCCYQSNERDVHDALERKFEGTSMETCDDYDLWGCIQKDFTTNAKKIVQVFMDHIRPMCKKLSLSDVQIAEADKDGRLVALPSDKALTNADRMRAATNQQLAKLLYDNQKEFCRLMYKNLGFEDELTFPEDYSDILAWLNAPAEMGVVQDKDE